MKVFEIIVDYLYDIKYFLKNIKNDISDFIFSIKFAFSFYKDIRKNYINNYEGKSGLYAMFKVLIPLIDEVINKYDLKWAEDFYKVPDLENRLKRLKENMELYNKRYIYNEKEYTGPCDAFDYLEDKIKNIEDVDLYLTLEKEYYRQKRMLEKEILEELKELLPFIWI